MGAERGTALSSTRAPKTSADIGRENAVAVDQAQAKGKKEKLRVVAIKTGFDGARRRKEGSRFVVAANKDEFGFDEKSGKHGIRKGARWQQLEADYEKEQKAIADRAEDEEVGTTIDG